MRMNRRFAGLLLALLLGLLAACAPAGEEPAAQQAPDAEEQATAPVEPEKNVPELDEDEQRLAATKSPELATTPAVEDMEPMLSDDAASEDAGQDEDAGTNEPVAPVTVDLSEVMPPARGTAKPDPEEGDEPVEQPEPGSPNLTQTMSHRAAMALSKRLGVDVSEIEIVSIEEVQWRDSSLGCPQPGMNYLMVITPGFRVVLEVNGETYEYHTDQRRNVVLCQTPGKITPGPGTGTSDR